MDNLMMENNYSETKQYSHSKFANVLFTKELARRLEGKFVSPSVVLCVSCSIENVDERLQTLNKGLLGKMTKTELIQVLKNDHESIVPLNSYKSPLDVLSD